MKENPNFYAILPANVRYDENLKANEKILYAEITALSNKEGYCYATNSYFADLYGVHKVTISTWISNLKTFGYIKVKNIYEKGSKQIKERRIYISESLIPISENTNTPISENTKENNTSINNKYIYSAFFEECWKLYPNKKGKGQVSDTKKKEIYKLGDEFKRCISRYVKDVEEERKKGFKDLNFKNGSTFFNSGYVDYLDKNYEESVEEKESREPFVPKFIYRDL